MEGGAEEPAAVVAAADAARFLRFRTIIQKMATPAMAMTATPPTTPPTMAPVLLGEEPPSPPLAPAVDAEDEEDEDELVRAF